MEQPSLDPEPAASEIFAEIYSQTRSAHLAFLISPIIYVILGFVIKNFVMGTEPGLVGLSASAYLMLQLIFLLVSAVIGYLLLFELPRRNSPQNILARKDVSSSLELGQALQVTHMIQVFLAVAIAIFGLLLFLLNGRLFHLFVFATFAFSLLIVIYPRRSRWEEAKSLAEREC